MCNLICYECDLLAWNGAFSPNRMKLEIAEVEGRFLGQFILQGDEVIHAGSVR